MRQCGVRVWQLHMFDTGHTFDQKCRFTLRCKATKINVYMNHHSTMEEVQTLIKQKYS